MESAWFNVAAEHIIWRVGLCVNVGKVWKSAQAHEWPTFFIELINLILISALVSLHNCLLYFEELISTSSVPTVNELVLSNYTVFFFFFFMCFTVYYYFVDSERWCFDKLSNTLVFLALNATGRGTPLLMVSWVFWFVIGCFNSQGCDLEINITESNNGGKSLGVKTTHKCD